MRVGFLSWLLEITKTGEKLGDREKTALLSWLADNGHDDFPLQDCFTVQYSLSSPHIASTLFSSANPANVRKNIEIAGKQADPELVREVKSIIGDQLRDPIEWK